MYCSVVIAHLMDCGTITRTDRHNIFSDQNRIPVQFSKELDWFKLPLVIPENLSNKIEQIDLCLGTNGTNNTKIELILNTESYGTFYYNKHINDNEYISLRKGAKNNFLKNNFLYLKSSAIKNCALWALEAKTVGFSTWKIEKKEKVFYPVIYALENPDKIYTNIDKIVYLWGVNKFIIISIILLSLFTLIYACKKLLRGNLKYFALLVFSVMVHISIFFPPLMQADEPQHLISYLLLTNQTEKIKEVENCVKKTHFSRMLFNEHEKFTSLDINNMSSIGLPEKVESSSIESRSFVTPFVWKTISLFIGQFSITKQVFVIRIIHSAFFSICLYFCINRFNFNLYVIICSIPTLLCVGTAVSNYIFSFIILIIIINQSYKSMLTEGNQNKIFCLTMISILSFESVSFTFLIPLLLFLNIPKHNIRDYIGYFIFFTLVIYIANDFSFKSKFSSILSNTNMRFIVFIVCNLVILKIFSKIYKILPCFNLLNIPKKYYLIILASTLLSIIFANPTNVDIESSEIGYSAFIKNFIEVIFCWFRLESPDYLSQVTLFTGFGWLDFRDSTLTTIINYSIFIILPFISTGYEKKICSKSFLFYLIILSGSVLMLLTSLYVGNVNPHGRYYLSYFCIFIMILSFYVKIPVPKNFILLSIKSNIHIIVISFFICVYSYSIVSIFNRYY